MLTMYRKCQVFALESAATHWPHSHSIKGAYQTSFHSCSTELERLHSRVTFTAKINVLTLHLHSSLVGFVGRRANTRLPPCSDTIVAIRQPLYVETHSHVQVLLCLLDVPLDLSVNVEVELLGHWERDQRRPLRVGLLTTKQTNKHKKSQHKLWAVWARGTRFHTLRKTRVASRVHLTSNPGCDAAGLRWGGPRRWLVRTGDPRNRPRPPQTTQTQHRERKKVCQQRPNEPPRKSKHCFLFLPAAFCQTSGSHC